MRYIFAKVVALLTPNAVAKRTLITSQGCDTLTAIVLAEWFYCDHQSALAEYNTLYSSLGLIARRSQCLFLHSEPWKNGDHCRRAPRNMSSLV